VAEDVLDDDAANAAAAQRLLFRVGEESYSCDSSVTSPAVLKPFQSGGEGEAKLLNSGEVVREGINGAGADVDEVAGAAVLPTTTVPDSNGLDGK
jgi:hypothetical protein